MSWFGFDFNCDGESSFGEQLLSMGMMGFFNEEKHLGREASSSPEESEENMFEDF